MKTIGWERESGPGPYEDPGDPGSEVEVICGICEREFLVNEWDLPTHCNVLLPTLERFSELWKNPTWIYNRLCNGFTPGPAFRAAEEMRRTGNDPETEMYAITKLLHVAWQESEHRCRNMIAKACTEPESGHVYEERQAQLWDLLTIPDAEPWCHGTVKLDDDI